VVAPELAERFDQALEKRHVRIPLPQDLR